MDQDGRRVLRCALGWIPSVEWAGLYLAEQRGELARRGLAVEVLAGGPGHPGAARRVAAGEADIGLPSDAVDVVRVIAAGADLVIVGATMAYSPLGFAWLPDTAIGGLGDLVDARVGAGAENDRVVLDVLFRSAGLPARYDFHLIGHDTAELEAGSIDAMCCSTVSQPAAAALRDLTLGTATFADWGLPLPADLVVVHRRLLESEPGAVAGFLAALAAGWRANEEDPDVAARLVADGPGREHGLSYEWSVAENDAQRPFVVAAPNAGRPWLWFDPAELADTVGALGEASMGGHGDPAGHLHRAVDLSLLDD